MLDPLSALNLAAAVVQFVDFGSKLLVDGYSSYRSVEGASADHLEIASVAKDLDELCERLWQAPPVTTVQCSKGEEAITRLARDCQTIARELSSLLEDLKVTSSGTWRGWEAARQAVRRSWKNDKIKKMQRRVETIRSQINTHLLDLIKNSQSSVMISLLDLTAKTENMHLENMVELRQTRKILIEAVQRQERELRDLRTATKLRETSGDKYYVVLNSYQESVAQLVDNIDTMQEHGRITATTQHILDSLRFDGMQMRHSDIHEAHTGTYGWIFDADSTPFKTWLQSQDGTFWISGKAGSGKSTLMKYLDNHAETETILNAWAAEMGRPLVKASFYFWNSGHPLQRKQEGLLRSLLFQLLRQCPSLVPSAFPRRWAADSAFHRHPDPWSRKELSDALSNILENEQTGLMAQFCFFIDGLDEYEGAHYELANDLSAISQSEFVKLCVSSRPWTEFADAFGQNKDRFIMMQDLTRTDMDKYVQSMLGEDERFAQLCETDPRGQVLIADILEKSQGVFLWVFLVVRSLREGLSRHDDISILQTRLKDMPSDLEDYFRHILANIDRAYRGYTARIFQLAIQAVILPLVTLWYLPIEVEHPERLLQEPVVHPLSSEDAEDFQKTATYRINAWCRDLLEVHDSSLTKKPMEQNSLLRLRIGFLHRTVRDFLQLKDIQMQLDSCINTEFNPWLTLMRAHLIEAKSLNMKHELNWSMHTFENIAREFMFAAKNNEAHTGSSPVSLIDELDKVCNYYCALISDSNKTSNRKISDAPGPGDSIFECDFLTYCTQVGLTQYVQKTLQKEFALVQSADEFHKRRISWLLYKASLGSRSLSLEMISMLLKMGANINLRLGPNDDTVWQAYLRRCYFQKQSEDLWRIAELFISAGANMRAPVVPRGVATDLTISAQRNSELKEVNIRQCLKCVCPAERKYRLEEILGPEQSFIARKYSILQLRSIFSKTSVGIV